MASTIPQQPPAGEVLADLQARVEELESWRTAQEQVWSAWAEGKAAITQGRSAPARRPRRSPPRLRAGGRHLKSVQS